MCLYVCQNQSLSCPWWRVQCHPHQGMVSYHSICNGGFSRSHREPGNNNGPSGLSLVKAGGLNLHIHSPASQSLDASCSQKGTRCWEKQLPLADMGFQRATVLRALSPKPPQQMGKNLAAHIHWGSFIFHEWDCICLCFSSLEKWIGPEWSLLRAVSRLLVVSEELFQWTVGRREESR